jgi:hypothetical protein
MTDELELSPFKTVYVYDADTGEYLHQYQAQHSPLEPGVYIEPVSSTDQKSPTVPDNKAAVFSKTKNSWALISDYRGQLAYSQKDGSSITITNMGDIPSGFALTPPPPTQEQQLASLKFSVSTYIDNKAKEKDYDSASSCISYMNSTNADWKKDATAMNAWRDAVWTFCYTSKKGLTDTTLPTTEKLIAALPAAPW